MKIVAVNVNGVRAALRNGIGPWMEGIEADVICMSEVRAPDEIVRAEYEPAWHVAHQASEQKGRSGVAILSKIPMTDVIEGLTFTGVIADAATHTGRWLEATVETPSGPLRIVSTYVHSGTAGTPKMDDKYEFLEMVTARLKELAAKYERVVVMGDINIAHTNNDIKNWKGNLKSAGFLPEERAYLDSWFADGWVDTHRTFVGEQEGPYTWWSARGKAFDNDSGWRIDYQLATPTLAAVVTNAFVDRAPSYEARWSDHAPVVVEYAL